MSNEITTTQPNSLQKCVEVENQNLELTASTPDEMAVSQRNLIDWCETKIAIVGREWSELVAAYEHAKRSKWKWDTLKRHADRALKRVEYYTKIKLALEAGFIIVPNFPVTMFAIRTERKNPLKMLSTSEWSNREQHPEGLPVGEGEYKNPFPVQFQRAIPDPRPDKPDNKTKEYWAEKYEDIEFPVNMARPHIMEATTRAMALNIFDEFGILPGPKVKIDPLIVGRIKNPRAPKYQRDGVVTFIVAWHLDTRTL